VILFTWTPQLDAATIIRPLKNFIVRDVMLIQDVAPITNTACHVAKVQRLDHLILQISSMIRLNYLRKVLKITHCSTLSALVLTVLSSYALFYVEHLPKVSFTKMPTEAQV
jgi:hypothetical protein